MRVLCLVDVNKSPMKYLYEEMDRAKDVIASFYSHEEKRYCPIWNIIDHRSSKQLHRPLHVAKYYLNAKFFYVDSLDVNEKVSTNFQLCTQRMVSDEATRNNIVDELQVHKKAKGYLFQSPQCLHRRTT